MQAVILAAGKGTRMGELTRDTPKPLIKVGTQTLLEYKLDTLPKEITQVIIVVGFLNHKIREYLGNSYGSLSIVYAEQKELNGTAGALCAAKDLLTEEFVVMMGDDIYSTEDIKECMKHDWAINAKLVRNQDRGGELLLDTKGNYANIYEPKHYIDEGYVNSGLYKMQHTFFDYDMVKVEGTGEYGIPHTLTPIAKKEVVSVIVTDHPWIQITNQEDIKNLEKTITPI